MNDSEKTDIVSSTYKGLVILTTILLCILIAKKLFFSYELYSYEADDKDFYDNKIFSDIPIDSSNKKIVEVYNTGNDTVSNKNPIQKNIIKDLTVNEKIVNINNSLRDELITLPGVGGKTADKIIDYREKQGDFKTKEDLMKVKGIGPAKLKKIKDLIKL